MNLIKNFKVLGLLTMSMMISSSCVAVSGSDSFIIGDSGREQVIGSGNKVTKNVTVNGSFNQISLPSIVDVSITQGSSNSISITGSDNLIKYCKVSIADNTLTVTLTKEAEHISFRKFDVTVNVTAKDLNNVSISGTGDVNFKGNFSTTDLKCHISGTGDITIPSLKAENFNTTISGTGDVKVKGVCSKVSLSVSGTGDIQADLTSVINLKASISGTGDIELSGSSEYAEYSVNGTGDIEAKDMIVNNVVAVSSGTGDIDCYASESFSGKKSSTAGLKCYGKPAQYTLTKN